MERSADQISQGGSCAVCAAPARVRILLDYQDGGPVLGQYCLSCADSAPDRYYASKGDASTRTEWFARVCLLGGVAICLVAALGDFLHIAGNAGFGWQQRTGILIGIILVLLAAILRIDILGIAGAILLCLSALADVIHVGQSAGFGWKQEGCMFAAIAVISIGLYLRRMGIAADPRRQRAATSDPTGN